VNDKSDKLTLIDPTSVPKQERALFSDKERLKTLILVREIRHQMTTRGGEFAVEDEAFFSFLRRAKSSRFIHSKGSNAGYFEHHR
jgi:hypothetical protein